MENKSSSAADKLLQRVDWLAEIFWYTAILLICGGVLWAAIFNMLSDTSLWKVGIQIMAFSILPILGYKYCSFITKEYRSGIQEEQSALNEREEMIVNSER